MISVAKHVSGCYVCGFDIRPGQLVKGPGSRLSRHAFCEPQAHLDGRCDTCGAPATQIARDVLRHIAPGREFYTLAPEAKRGCAAHPVAGIVREVVLR